MYGLQNDLYSIMTKYLDTMGKYDIVIIRTTRYLFKSVTVKFYF